MYIPRNFHAGAWVTCDLKSMARVLLLNGPNLNLLGSREPGVYGVETLETIEKRAAELAHQAGHELVAFQSNSEAELIGRIHGASASGIGFLIFNPAAFTHTSVALRDALLAVRLPFVEVHLSNTYAREPFRHHSYFSDIAAGVITGLGAFGYELAMQAAVRHLARPS
jgi:3-dehydroquinate dehydratase-2